MHVINQKCYTDHKVVILRSVQVDANVIAVDWSGGGGSWMYWRAVANTRVTGAEVTTSVILQTERNNKKNIFKRPELSLFSSFYTHTHTQYM